MFGGMLSLLNKLHKQDQQCLSDWPSNTETLKRTHETPASATLQNLSLSHTDTDTHTDTQTHAQKHTDTHIRN